MGSKLREALLASISSILRPIASLLLKSGVGCSEFLAVAKEVFVDVATEEYGIRGRPTNASRVAAMTGLSRKDVARIRSNNTDRRWTPSMEMTPINTVLHYWHFDPEFCVELGVPKAVPFEGAGSFSELVRRYAGDIPPGAMRIELKRTGSIEETESGALIARARYFHPTNFHDDFIRNIGFSIGNLAATVVHNADLVRNGVVDKDTNDTLGRFERVAWTDGLDLANAIAFKAWARQEGTRFIEEVDDWIGGHENGRGSIEEGGPRVVGLGVYYFEDG